MKIRRHIAAKSSAASKKAVVIIALLSISFGIAEQNKTATVYDGSKKFTVQQLRFDLIILKDALLKVHTGLFWHQPESEFEASFQALNNAITQPMTELEFYTLISPFIARIRCDHTNLEMSAPFYNTALNRMKVFPYGLKLIDPKIYINYNYATENTIQPGSEVLAINGISADSILRFLRSQSWADGYKKSLARFTHEEFMNPALLYLFREPELYTLNIKEPNGNLRTVEAHVMDYKTFKRRDSTLLATWLSPRHENFSFKRLDSLSTGIIKIKAFMGSGYYRFLKHCFDTLERKHLNNLVIDVRGNGGGYGEYTRPLYQYFALKPYWADSLIEMKIANPNDTVLQYGELPERKKAFVCFVKHKLRRAPDGRQYMKYGVISDLSRKPFKPRKNPYKGRVFILTDISTSSGGSDICMFARSSKRATFIGRETGGGYLGNTSGWEFALTLPNSKVIVRIPMIRFYNAVSGVPGEGIKPDYPMPENINDVILNRDSELEFTLDLIKRQNTPR